ncbi:hypothetical protein BKA70DRAFT_1432096 [Coprinopsis sp. MPI-PUGE-AT-0042]|nr:hypothetical protein BKA70DRAFT_1432096 [Coprinopsis sp. MPI-PUGE-AT-0042]
MRSTVLFVGGLLACFAEATIRFGCSQLVTERFDPLVTPGQVSSHLHQIIGGNACVTSVQFKERLT